MDIHTFATHVAPHAGLGTVQLIGLAYVIAIAAVVWFVMGAKIRKD